MTRAPVPGTVDPPWPSSVPVAALLRARVDFGAAASAAVALVGRGDVRVAQRGTLGRLRRRPVGPDTVYEIGSVTKALNGVLAAELHLSGALPLETRVRALLPAADGARVPAGLTLEHLVTHRAGLARTLPGTPTDPTQPYRDTTEDAVLAALATAIPAAPYAYSNLGHAALGALWSRALGAPYEHLLSARVLAPLRLGGMAFSLAPASRPRLATGYNAAGLPVPPWRFGAMAPAGGLVSDIRSATALLQMCLDPPDGAMGQALRLAMAPRHEAGTLGLWVGLGWRVTERLGARTVWHDGETGGHRAFVGVDAVAGRGVAVLQSGPPDANALGWRLLDARSELAVGAEPEPLRPDEAAAFCGVYALPAGLLLRVWLDGDHLGVQVTGQLPGRVFPTGPGRFRWPAIGAELAFEPPADGPGPAGAVRLHHAGRKLRATRAAS